VFLLLNLHQYLLLRAQVFLLHYLRLRVLLDHRLRVRRLVHQYLLQYPHQYLHLRAQVFHLHYLQASAHQLQYPLQYHLQLAHPYRQVNPHQCLQVYHLQLVRAFLLRQVLQRAFLLQYLHQKVQLNHQVREHNE